MSEDAPHCRKLSSDDGEDSVSYNEPAKGCEISGELGPDAPGDVAGNEKKEPRAMIDDDLEEMQKEKHATDAEFQKMELIIDCCLRCDRIGLADLAVTDGGLLNDEARQQAWLILLGHRDVVKSFAGGSQENEIKEKPLRSDWRQLPVHRDEEQVRLDVNRSFVYYPTNLTTKQLEDRRTQLSDLILEVLRRRPMLCYFQVLKLFRLGFHDICQVILLAIGPVLAPIATEYISLLRIRDFMLPSLSPALVHLHLIHPILNAVDPKLCKHVSAIQPYFALAATLTLYAHEIQVYSDVARLFDVFLAESPAFPVYFFAVIVISRRDELLDIPDDEPDMLHAVLSRLPKPLNLESFIKQARALRIQHPPNEFPIWRSISSNSVLKTYTSPVTSTPLVDVPTFSEALAKGEAYFAKQCSELAREKLKNQVYTGLVKNRNMIGWTVIVGASAVAMGFYFGKKGMDTRLMWDSIAKSSLFG